MPIQIVPQPVVTPGAGDVTGGTNLTTANRVMIVAGSSEAGQSDVSLSSGIFSRAGTLGLSATGANVINLSTNGLLRLFVASDGNVVITHPSDVFLKILSNATTAASAYMQFERSTTGAARRYYLGTGLNSTAEFSLYDSTNSVFRWVVTPAGNMTVGGSTEGNYRLDVQSSGSTGTMRVYDQTAVTGSSTLVVRAGAGQSTTALQTWQNNATNTLASLYSGSATNTTFAINIAGGTSALALANINSDGWIYNSGATNLILGVSGAAVLTLTSAGYVQFATAARVGFFGVAPVARQTATADAASILALLQAYGLSN